MTTKLSRWNGKHEDYLVWLPKVLNIRVNNGVGTEPLGCFQKKYTNIDVGLISCVIISKGNFAMCHLEVSCESEL